MFLPAPVPPIFASSCRAPSELSLQATFRLQNREALALVLVLQGTHPQGPAGTRVQNQAHLSGAAGNCWSAGSVSRLIPMPLESEKSLPTPSVRGKLAHLTSAKCRDQEIPLHLPLCRRMKQSFPAASGH